MTLPLTSTRPASIRRSPSRREATPAPARYFCSRIPSPGSGIVPVVLPFALVVIIVLGILAVPGVVFVLFLEGTPRGQRLGRGLGRPRRGAAGRAAPRQDPEVGHVR